MEVTMKEKKHFVLVHGACHGAWCWYKLIPLLESAGHRVTALDLAASGINPKQIQDVPTFSDYTAPLLQFMASIPAEEKVILVGHSFGGLSLALATEKFPEKILVAVFMSAFMPDTVHAPSYVLETYNERTPEEAWLDTQFLPIGSPESPRTSMLFGPKYLAYKLYQLCSCEDLELAKLLVRPSSLFIEDLSKAPKFSNEGYGSVKRIFILCHEDKGMLKEFQEWLIESIGVEEVKEIRDADHMAMLSTPLELRDHLLEIAQSLANLQMH